MEMTPGSEPTRPAEWSPAVRSLSLLIASSYQQLLGESLVDASPDQLATTLYNAPFALLAHDGGDDPRFTYANRTAQRLWEREWDEFVGLPSRLSAEPDDRTTRASMLEEVSRTGFIANYSGVRVSASGIRFLISQAKVWNLLDPSGLRIGQAARIDSWERLSR